MKIWLISQDENNDYDTFDSAVVIAETEDDARRTLPASWANWEDKRGNWASDWVKVSAELIGEALPGMPAGAICASFNAG